MSIVIVCVRACVCVCARAGVCVCCVRCVLLCATNPVAAAMRTLHTKAGRGNRRYETTYITDWQIKDCE